MKHHTTGLKKVFKKPVVIIVLVLILGGVVVGIVSSKPKDAYEYAVVERGNLVQEVSVSGTVRPVAGVDLAFEKSGRVSSVPFAVGDEVSRGATLARLVSYDLAADLSEAEANLAAEKAELEKLERGPRQEEIAVAQAELEEAKQSLANAYDSVSYTLNEVYTKADDAARVKTSSLFSGTEGSSFDVTFNACNETAENGASLLRLRSGSVLWQWSQELQALSGASYKELETALQNALGYLQGFREFLERTYDLLITGCTIGNSAYDAYRTNVSTARSAVTTALSSASDLKQIIASRKAAVEKEEKELAELLAGASPEDISVQRAKVLQAEASVENAGAQIEKTILRAPFAGVVTKVNVTVGEIASAEKPAISLMSSDGFEIRVYIPEADIVKVVVGDAAGVTLDAYGGDTTFQAIVTTIDAAETVIEGVSTYEATLHFVEPSERISSGMTANVDIVTATRENVVFIPQRAVVRRDGAEFVRVLADGEVKEVEVSPGLKDSSGNVEVISGVSEGDQIVTFAR